MNGDWCDVVIEPWAGAEISETFWYARHLATTLRREVVVRGNDVAVKVTPDMDDRSCKAAYEYALNARRQGR